MILTTTNSIDDYKILTYKGIVSGCALKMPKITMTFSMEKYYTGFSERVSELKENALLILKEKAESLNANAVIGIQVDVEVATDASILVTATGTAVNISKY